MLAVQGFGQSVCAIGKESAWLCCLHLYTIKLCLWISAYLRHKMNICCCSEDTMLWSCKCMFGLWVKVALSWQRNTNRSTVAFSTCLVKLQLLCWWTQWNYSAYMSHLMVARLCNALSWFLIRKAGCILQYVYV